MNEIAVDIPQKPIREFISKDINFDSWNDLKEYFNDLLDREINSGNDLEKWLKDKSELESVVSEELGWRYINMTRDTEDETKKELYQHFVSDLEPEMTPLKHLINQRLIESPYLKDIDTKDIEPYLKYLRKQIEIYREENIPHFAEAKVKQQEYSVITGKLIIKHKGKELTLQQASTLLKNPDRALREEVFNKIVKVRELEREPLNQLFNQLIEIRQTIASNAGFDNYRDYKFMSLGRFDYTPEDCFTLHEAVEQEIMPIIDLIMKDRKEKLGARCEPGWQGISTTISRC